MPRERIHRLPAVLRAALLMALLVVLLTGIDRRDGAPDTVRLRGDPDDVERLAALLLDPTPPVAIFRDAGPEPTETELGLLAEAARRAPTVVELPTAPPSPRVTPPDLPLTGRFAAIRFRDTAPPGDTVTVRLVSPGGGTLDSVRAVAGARGVVEGAFRFRPSSEGWTTWRIDVSHESSGTGRTEGTGSAPPAGEAGRLDRTRSATASASAWVAAAGPPRILAVSGPPSWESRYAVRALERSGVSVGLVQSLGRDNVVTSGGASSDWSAPASLARYDAVILLPGLDPEPADLDALESWVAAGHGVLAAGEAAGRLGLGRLRPSRSGRPVPAGSIRWTGPPELVPLPAVELELETGALGSLPPATRVAATSIDTDTRALSAGTVGRALSAGTVGRALSAGTVGPTGEDGDALLVLAPLGRGRLAALAPLQSWRWVLEAGREPEHRAFWRSLVDWIAAPAADSLSVRVRPVRAAAGTTIDVLSTRPLELIRPGGAARTLRTPDGPGVRVGRFVAADTGLHQLRLSGDRGGVDGESEAGAAGAGPGETRPGSPTVAAFRSVAGGDAPAARLGSARLALLATASGGAAIPADSFHARLDARAVMGTPGPVAWGPASRPGGLATLIFGVLALLALLEWSLRRLRGRP